MKFDLEQVAKAFMILFAVIDILGSIPIIIKLKEKAGHIHSLKASIVALIIMLVFCIFRGFTLLWFYER